MIARACHPHYPPLERITYLVDFFVEWSGTQASYALYTV